MKAPFMQLACVATVLSGAVAALTESQIRARDLAVSNYEERFLDTLAWQHSNQTVKLVGYMKIRLTEDQLGELEHNIKHRPGEWEEHSSAFYDEHERTLRVYFPVENGLMYHDNKLVEATHMGEFPHHEMVNGDCSVVGRYQTEHVHGIDTNRIEDGIIYLAQPAPPVRTYGDKSNVYVYDFGWRTEHDHHHDHHDGHPHAKRSDEEGEGRSCKQNHGGRVCSLVYNINNGRCKRDYSKCIDYNGWPIKECSSKSKKGFVGSDCFDAVAEGHCWNEVEAAV